MTKEELRAYQVPKEKLDRILLHCSLPKALYSCRIPVGEASALFLLVLPQGNRAVLRVWNVCDSRARADGEACTLLHSAGLPVPMLLAPVDTSRKLLEHAYSLLSWLPGEDAWRAFGRFGPADQRRMIRSLGRRLAQVHTLTIPSADTSVLPWGRPTHEWAAEREYEFQQLVRQHRTRCLIPGKVMDETEAAWEKWRQWLGHGHFCLLHGDANLANAKVSFPEPEISGLFDFDQTDIGEAERDFAPMETWRLKGWEEYLRAEFYAGYQEERPLASGHCERVKAYTLLRDLRIVLEFEGPLAPPCGAGSSVEAIHRLVREA